MRTTHVHAEVKQPSRQRYSVRQPWPHQEYTGANMSGGKKTCTVQMPLMTFLLKFSLAAATGCIERTSSAGEKFCWASFCEGSKLAHTWRCLSNSDYWGQCDVLSFKVQGIPVTSMSRYMPPSMCRLLKCMCFRHPGSVGDVLLYFTSLHLRWMHISLFSLRNVGTLSFRFFTTPGCGSLKA